jgi:N-acetylglutamate synthase and related acetyltransferases
MTHYQTANADASQVAQISEIEKKAAAIFPPGKIPKQLMEATVDESELLLAIVEDRLWVIMEKGNDNPLGFVLLRFFGQIIYIAEIDVLPEYGRRGLGAALLSQVISHGRDKAFTAIYLTTFATIPWNAPFYAKHGFSTVEDDLLPDPIRKTIENERKLGFSDRVGMRLVLQPA